MPLKLVEIYVDNYKSFHKAAIKLDDFNIVVGANNAGKTNLVDLLEFIDIAVKYGLIAAVKKKGGFNKIKNYRSSDDFIEIKAVFTMSGRSASAMNLSPHFLHFVADLNHRYVMTFRFTGGNRYLSKLEIASKSTMNTVSAEEWDQFPFSEYGEIRDAYETLLKGGRTFDVNISLMKDAEKINGRGRPDKYKRIFDSPVLADGITFTEGIFDETVDIDIRVRENGPVAPEYYVALFQSFFEWVRDVAENFIEGKMALAGYLDYLKANAKFEVPLRMLFGGNIKAFNLDVNAIRNSGKSSQTEILDRDGANLQYVLEYLKNNDADNEDNRHQFEIITASLAGVVDEVEDVAVEEQRRGTDKVPEIIFKEKGGFPVAREDISDGTLVLLAIITGLYANRNRHFLVVIEEPEHHLHMNAISYLMEVFRDYAKGTQLIITTQSSEVLRDVEPDADNLVFVYRDYDSLSQAISSRDIDELKMILDKYEYNMDEIVRLEILGYLGDYAD